MELHSGTRTGVRASSPIRRPRYLAVILSLVAAALCLTFSSAYAADKPVLKRIALSIGGGMSGQNRSYAYYASSKANRAGYNFLIFALHDDGQTAEEFAQSSGWIKVAEDNGVLVVFPEAQNKTWSPFAGDETAYLKEVYDNASTHLTGDAAPDGRPVRYGTWAPWQYFTGAGAGGRVAQEFAIDNPGLVTAVATLNATTYDAAFAKGDETVQGYLINQRGGKLAVPASRPAKKDVPVPAWLFTAGAPTAAETRLADYWKHANGVAGAPASQTVGGLQAATYANPANGLEQVRLTALPASAHYDESLASAIWSQFFSHVARWNSAPNGEIGPMMTEPEINKIFDIHTTAVGDRTYKYYVKAPSTYRKGQSLPMVLSLHGAMYPAWMFASQMRWQDLGEKEGFITVYLNGQQNRWDFTKPEAEDSKAIEQTINEVAAQYGIDRGRVYMQGFSFGSGMTFVEGVTHPRLFAAVSPHSGIGDFTPEVNDWIANVKRQSDIRLPMMVLYGSVDGASSTDGLIPAVGLLHNSIELMKGYDHITTPDKVTRFNSPYVAAYDVLTPGGKLTTIKANSQYKATAFQRYDYVSADPKPLPLFSWVWVTDMPHGTAPGQTELTWSYFKNWRRNPDGSLSYSGR